MSRARGAVQLWLWPVLLGLLSGAGLGIALVSEGWGNLVSWAALTIPVIACLMYGVLPLRPGR